ncbi:hypothetical protein WH50_14075 [Pokkaliibacter plantistimulans]|uniref:Response regulator n=2 Tax=Pokkaliibacter plantistimulans TaxID=1635171 RepID=A0ABX5LYU2_9GAMM|nr:hypothetical protein WH50_14075 [Pokkaliibacter plantistimulans]
MSNQMPKVMFVDDEVGILQALKRNLHQSGWDMSFVDDPLQALAQLKDGHFDLVISDMKMPRMDGVELLSQVEKISPDTIRIVLTGQPETESAIDAVNRGHIHSYLLKPIEIGHLRSVMEAGLKVSHEQQRKKAMLYALARQNNGLKTSIESTLTKVSELQNSLSQGGFEHIVSTFGTLLEMLHASVFSQPFRAGLFCRKLIAYLGLDAEFALQVYYATLLHDIGLIGISGHHQILSEATLINIDRQMYEQYPIISSAALLDIDGFNMAQTFITQHRERYNGSGFPYRLREDAITTGAYIVGLVTYADRSLDDGGSAESVKSVIEKLEYSKDRFYPADLVEALIGVLSEHFNLRAGERIHWLTPDQLKPGMILTRSLYSHTGIRLLAKGALLNEKLIRKLSDYVERTKLELHLGISESEQTSE